MRYAIVDKGLGLSQIERECLRFGGKNIKKVPLLGQLFCDLDAVGKSKLSQIPGLSVKENKTISANSAVAVNEEALPTYATSAMPDITGFLKRRDLTSPPLIGEGYTVCVLDTGIRKTHRGLVGKVVYEANFTDSPDCSDVFGHGTGVAYLICGGRHALYEESGMSPGASIMNIKIMGDDGRGTVESVVKGIEECCRLDKLARDKELPRRDPMNPGTINMSFGIEDDGDPDNPVRVALRKAREDYELLTYAAAGNGGPELGTILCPACDPEVMAVGATTFVPLDIWEKSSRGPTKEGNIKPDVVGPAVNIVTASAKGDDSFVVKSGTSFSCPQASGGTGITWDLMMRMMGGEEFVLPMKEIIDQYLPYLCQKPAGAPADKDNTYGYGVIKGDFLEMVMKQASPMAIVEPMVTSAVTLASLSMMTRMMSTIMRGFVR